MDIAWLDVIIGGLLVAGAFRGASVGAIRQVASVAGVVLAFAMAIQLMRPVGTLIVESLNLAPSLVPVVGFVAVFAGVQLVFVALARLVEGVLDAVKLTVLNRAAGGALGAFKAALVVSAASVVLGAFQMPPAEMRQASVLYGPVARVLPSTWGFLEARIPELRSLAEAFETRTNDLPAQLGLPSSTPADAPPPGSSPDTSQASS